MYIINKSEERKQREEAVLKMWNHPVNASPEIREYAEGAAEGIRQALKELEKRK